MLRCPAAARRLISEAACAERKGRAVDEPMLCSPSCPFSERPKPEHDPRDWEPPQPSKKRLYPCGCGGLKSKDAQTCQDCYRKNIMADGGRNSARMKAYWQARREAGLLSYKAYDKAILERRAVPARFGQKCQWLGLDTGH